MHLTWLPGGRAACFVARAARYSGVQPSCTHSSGDKGADGQLGVC